MAGTILPRQFDIAKGISRDHGRIRRMEVNRQNGMPPPAVSNFPAFTGSGSPDGVQVAQYGDWYEDTASGALYNFQGTSGTDLGWVQCAGLGVGQGFGIKDPYGHGIALNESGGGGIHISVSGGGASTVTVDGSFVFDSTGGQNVSIIVGAGANLEVTLAGGAGNLIITGLPTAAPIPAGSVWNNAGVLNIVP